MVKVGQNDTICVWEILKNFEVGKQNQFVPCCHKTSVGVDSKVKQKASTLKNYNQIYVELRLCLLQCSDNHPGQYSFSTAVGRPWCCYKNSWKLTITALKICKYISHAYECEYVCVLREAADGKPRPWLPTAAGAYFTMLQIQNIWRQRRRHLLPSNLYLLR